MAKAEFDLYDHTQGVLKKLMSKDYRDYVKAKGSDTFSESAGPFKVEIVCSHDSGE